MAYKGFVGEVSTLTIESATTGLTDIEINITDPAGTVVVPDTATTEIGTSKVYSATYTPTLEGTYVLKIISPTDTTINNRRTTLQVKPVSKFDLAGTGYDSATDSLKILSDKIDIITTNQSAGESGWLD